MEILKGLIETAGSEIISVLIGLLFGGVGGFALGKKSMIKQNQKAKDKANQNQQGMAITCDSDLNSTGANQTQVNQKQKARDNAVQTQIGSGKSG